MDGKVLEKLIKSKFAKMMQDVRDSSLSKFGFKAGKSTVNAVMQIVNAVHQAKTHSHRSGRMVLFVKLDVRNAFNSVRWNDILCNSYHVLN